MCKRKYYIRRVLYDLPDVTHSSVYLYFFFEFIAPETDEACLAHLRKLILRFAYSKLYIGWFSSSNGWYELSPFSRNYERKLLCWEVMFVYQNTYDIE